MTKDFGPVAIAGVLIALFIGVNDFYDRASDNLYAHKHDCLVSLMSTYDVLIRRAHLAKVIVTNNDPSVQDKAVDSDIDLNGKWAGVEAGCVLTEVLPHDNQVGGALDEAKQASEVPLTQTSADPNRIAGSVNWVRFAIAEVYGLKITQGWAFTCNIFYCLHSFPDQKYVFGYTYGEKN